MDFATIIMTACTVLWIIGIVLLILMLPARGRFEDIIYVLLSWVCIALLAVFLVFCVYMTIYFAGVIAGWWATT